ncbi:MAG: type II 3-dehydroquinate dehydratase [Clostridia bacterium]|jgi:3-dehydroquinate dehydratase-2|nr:type II 3-dehydroquinate dehydratase [Clostridia bacterium]MDD4145875.1 type II 3-dehydroquinate dehydratase [Clostridia bacterium]MDD4665420.1 type II 3-dehydroquinate dehydratase [Clostridia bacterium]
MSKVCIIHGPNLNLLGSREPLVYGKITLEELNKQLISYGQKLGLEVETFQSNHEGALVEKIQQAASYDYLVINAAAYTHTSIAIRDALLAIKIPAVEVHISNIYQREDFRQQSLLANVVQGQIIGLGVLGYRLALDAAAYFLQGGKSID